MTPIQQQRLIGAGLLVLLVAVLAYIVLSKVGQHQNEQSLELPEPIEFSSVIEPLDEDGVETVEGASEAMVDADLQQTTPAETTLAANDADTTETESEPAETPEATSSQAESSSAENTEETENTESETPAPPAQPMDRPAAQAETSAPEANASNTDNPTVVSEPNAGTSGDKWVIQLGSFSVQKNAQSLKTEAEKLGYQPYIENSQTDKGAIFRVRLPAVASRAEADDIAAKINGQLDTQAQVSKQ